VPDSFGARLRRKREEQQIALSAIAADTKIKLSLLEGLERDDVSSWPSGIFRRAYARALHLPADEVVAEFLATYPEPDTSDIPLSASFPKSAEADSWRERIWQFGRRAVQSDATSAPAPAVPSPDAPVIAERSAAEQPEAPAQDASASASPLRQQTPSSVDGAAPVMAADGPPPAAPAVANAASADALAFEPDLAAIAKVCTELGRVSDANDLILALEGAAEVMRASGVIVWLWDRSENALVPAFAHGYSSRVLDRLQPISYDSDNATAATLRSAEVSVVKRTGRQNGALVAPLMRAGGCIGVLAIEVMDGVEQISSAGHLARIIAAQLATLFDASMAATAAEPTAQAGSC
jgi:transcriptional regulator with XRE-family HTH domain